MDQKGQVVIVMLLIMVVALALGLAIVGHSITDISTSTRTEDSARAYSAAEAGIERALVSTVNMVAAPTPVVLDNRAQAQTSWNRDLPKTGSALEYPPFGKESFAHFWLAKTINPDSNGRDVVKHYDQDSIDLYFGLAQNYQNTPLDQDNQPAVEVHVVLARGNIYESRKFYIDSFNGTGGGRSSNGFTGCNQVDRDGDVGGYSVSTVTNNNTAASNFYCRATLTYRVPGDAGNVYPVLARVRILYSNLVHPVALKPIDSCAGSTQDRCSLPPQVSVYSSKGVSGNTQREIELFQQRNVVPYMFDYVLFSSGQIKK
jgi:hypothetical protein